MNLPIKFPSDAEVIIEETARFRACRRRSACGRSVDCSRPALMMRRSPKAAFLREYNLEQKNRALQAVKEFLERHAD